jgi:hypothetical protein
MTKLLHSWKDWKLKTGPSSLKSKSRFEVLFLAPLFAAALSASISVRANSSVMPPVCDDHYGIGKQKTQRLAEIAFAEAVRKKITMRRYKSVFALVISAKEKSDGMHVKNGPQFAVSFSTFQCDEEGLDGGSFTVKIDPLTLKVMQSRISPY